MASRLASNVGFSPSTDGEICSSSSEAAIWRRLIDPSNADLSPAAAESILRLSLSEDDGRRAHELTTKNKEGELSVEELAELENYCRVGRVLDLMHSKARRSLKSKVK